MSLVTGMFKSSTLMSGLLQKNPSSLTVAELDQLQQFINKGRSMILLDKHPQLEGIFSIHAVDAINSQSVVDIVVCFLEEGGTIGSPNFQKMVDGMVTRGMVSPAIVDVLQRNRFLLPGPLPSLNADGVAV